MDTPGDIGNLRGVISHRVENGISELVLAEDTSPQNILSQLHEKGMIINHFEIKKPSLNEIFLRLAGDNHE